MFSAILPVHRPTFSGFLLFLPERIKIVAAIPQNQEILATT
jgi:hypothetical protein